ncbi:MULTISPECIES: hypothetical protein [Comamonas]|uniref:hypothetical protein n=1 Tax=Comamonas TaxID=283 RepID=UPI0015FE2A3B|nr:MULTISPECIES: hypothetical protein [Comamonas]UUC92916.1 hypothetical protein NOX35_22030 [Comamonas sp. C11]
MPSPWRNAAARRMRHQTRGLDEHGLRLLKTTLSVCQAGKASGLFCSLYSASD